jgi:hypothetical protein
MHHAEFVNSQSFYLRWWRQFTYVLWHVWWFCMHFKRLLGTRFKARNCISEPGSHAGALLGHFLKNSLQNLRQMHSRAALLWFGPYHYDPFPLVPNPPNADTADSANVKTLFTNSKTDVRCPENRIDTSPGLSSVEFWVKMKHGSLHISTPDKSSRFYDNQRINSLCGIMANYNYKLGTKGCHCYPCIFHHSGPQSCQLSNNVCANIDQNNRLVKHVEALCYICHVW